MSKLAKAKNAGKKAIAGVRNLATKEGVGGFGHKIVQLGSHALLALASRDHDKTGPIPVSPDTAALGASIVGMMFLKGKARKLAASTALGAGHALVSRGVYGNLEISLTKGPDGKTQVEAE